MRCLHTVTADVLLLTGRGDRCRTPLPNLHISELDKEFVTAQIFSSIIGVSWSQNPPESTAGQQRGTEKADQSQCSSKPAGGVRRSHLLFLWHDGPQTPEEEVRIFCLIWACVFTVGMFTRHVEAHLGRANRRGGGAGKWSKVTRTSKQTHKHTHKKKSAPVWLRNKKHQRTRVTESLAFFKKKKSQKEKKTASLFSTVASRPETPPLPPPPPPQTVSRHGIFSGQCSPCCCSCSALWDLWFRHSKLQLLAFGGAGGPHNNKKTKEKKEKNKMSRGLQRSQPTNRLTDRPTRAVYCLCERLLGTFACCPA